MTSTWKTVHVFISSTFDDMHAERDYLVKRVFPELKEWCLKRRLRLVEVDLRWGVTEEDATANKNVVQKCLKAIDDCRPFFLCLLGQRRGWIPNQEDVSSATLDRYPEIREWLGNASLTEMEVLHAAFHPFQGTAAVEDASYTFFYCRSPFFLSSMPDDIPQLRAIYEGPATPPGPLDRERLRAGCTVRDYVAYWCDEPGYVTPELAIPLASPSSLESNIEAWRERWRQWAGIRVQGDSIEVGTTDWTRAMEYNNRLTRGRLSEFASHRSDEETLGPWADVVLSDLMDAIRQRYPDHHDDDHGDPRQDEVDHHEHRLYQHSLGFHERPGTWEELDRYLLDPHADRPFLLTGETGTGKSATLAAWVSRVRAGHSGLPQCTVYVRFLGTSDHSRTVDDVLLSLATQMQSDRRLASPIPSSPIALRSDWMRLLAESGEHGPTLVVLDGLNQLDSQLSDLNWLEQTLPANVKIVVSFPASAPGAQVLVERWRQNVAFAMASVPAFAAVSDRRALARTYLDEYFKALDDSVLNTLVEAPGAQNPLFLKVALSELRQFGSFGGLREKVQQAYGDGPISAFDGMLDRLENDAAYSEMTPGFVVPMLFGCLAHARHGLTNSEIADLLLSHYPHEYFGDSDNQHHHAMDASQLQLRQIRQFLTQGTQRQDFLYESFREAARRRYSHEGTSSTHWSLPSETWHQILGSYFEARCDEDDYALSEFFHHLVRGQEWARASTHLDTTMWTKKRRAFGSDRLFLEDLAEFAAAPATGTVNEARRLRAIALSSLLTSMRRDVIDPEVVRRLNHGDYDGALQIAEAIGNGAIAREEILERSISGDMQPLPHVFLDVVQQVAKLDDRRYWLVQWIIDHAPELTARGASVDAACLVVASTCEVVQGGNQQALQLTHMVQVCRDILTPGIFDRLWGIALDSLSESQGGVSRLVFEMSRQLSILSEHTPASATDQLLAAAKRLLRQADDFDASEVSRQLHSLQNCGAALSHVLSGHEIFILSQSDEFWFGGQGERCRSERSALRLGAVEGFARQEAWHEVTLLTSRFIQPAARLVGCALQLAAGPEDLLDSALAEFPDLWSRTEAAARTSGSIMGLTWMGGFENPERVERLRSGSSRHRTRQLLSGVDPDRALLIRSARQLVGVDEPDGDGEASLVSEQQLPESTPSLRDEVRNLAAVWQRAAESLPTPDTAGAEDSAGDGGLVTAVLSRAEEASVSATHLLCPRATPAVTGAAVAWGRVWRQWADSACDLARDMIEQIGGVTDDLIFGASPESRTRADVLVLACEKAIQQENIRAAGLLRLTCLAVHDVESSGYAGTNVAGSGKLTLGHLIGRLAAWDPMAALQVSVFNVGYCAFSVAQVLDVLSRQGPNPVTADGTVIDVEAILMDLPEHPLFKEQLVIRWLRLIGQRDRATQRFEMARTQHTPPSDESEIEERHPHLLTLESASLHGPSGFQEVESLPSARLQCAGRFAALIDGVGWDRADKRLALHKLVAGLVDQDLLLDESLSLDHEVDALSVEGAHSYPPLTWNQTAGSGKSVLQLLCDVVAAAPRLPFSDLMEAIDQTVRHHARLSAFVAGLARAPQVPIEFAIRLSRHMRHEPLTELAATYEALAATVAASGDTSLCQQVATEIRSLLEFCPTEDA